MKIYIAIFILTLTACGSGSSGGNNPPTQPPITGGPYTVTLEEDFGEYTDVKNISVEAGSTYSYVLQGLVDLYPDAIEFQGISGCGGFSKITHMDGMEVYESAPISSNCTARASYDITAKTAVIIKTEKPSEGAFISPPALSVLPGDSAAFNVHKSSAYDVNVMGCSGVLGDDYIYRIQSATEDCIVKVEATEKDAENISVELSSNMPEMVSLHSTKIAKNHSMTFHVKRGFNISAQVSGCGATQVNSPLFYTEPLIFETSDLSEDCTIEAFFEPTDPVGAVVHATSGTGGSVDAYYYADQNSPLQPDYPYINILNISDHSLVLMAVPAHGYISEDVTGCNGDIDDTLTKMLTADLLDPNCQPHFTFSQTETPVKSFVSIEYSGAGETTTEQLIVEEGTALSLSIEPRTGYQPTIKHCNPGQHGLWQQVDDMIYVSSILYGLYGCTIEVEYVPL